MKYSFFKIYIIFNIYFPVFHYFVYNKKNIRSFTKLYVSLGIVTETPLQITKLPGRRSMLGHHRSADDDPLCYLYTELSPSQLENLGPIREPSLGFLCKVKYYVRKSCILLA